MKRSAFIMTIVLAIAVTTACDKDEKKPAGTGTPPVVTTPEEGSGTATIAYADETMTVTGVCGSSDAFGYRLVTIQDTTVPTRTLSIGLNVIDLPMNTTVYMLTTSSENGATQAFMEFTNVQNSQITGWSSDLNSGNVTFVVNGDEITCNFTNIPLQPYEFYNVGDSLNVGLVTGSMTFYHE